MSCSFHGLLPISGLAAPCRANIAVQPKGLSLMKNCALGWLTLSIFVWGCSSNGSSSTTDGMAGSGGDDGGAGSDGAADGGDGSTPAALISRPNPLISRGKPVFSSPGGAIVVVDQYYHNGG